MVKRHRLDPDSEMGSPYHSLVHEGLQKGVYAPNPSNFTLIDDVVHEPVWFQRQTLVPRHRSGTQTPYYMHLPVISDKVRAYGKAMSLAATKDTAAATFANATTTSATTASSRALHVATSKHAAAMAVPGVTECIDYLRAIEETGLAIAAVEVAASNAAAAAIAEAAKKNQLSDVALAKIDDSAEYLNFFTSSCSCPSFMLPQVRMC
jgi:hypothetical protein